MTEQIPAETVHALADEHLLSRNTGPWSPRFERQVNAFVAAILAAQPARVVPSVEGMWDVAETAMTDDGHRMPRTDETRYLAHAAARAVAALLSAAPTVAEVREPPEDGPWTSRPEPIERSTT